jgi:type VI secretion system protein VasG
VRVDPRLLVRRLTATCARALENAVVRAHSNHFYEVTVEHVLLSLLESPKSDAAALLQHFGKDLREVASRLVRALETARTGNASRPVFSDAVFLWFEDAWLWTSIEHGASRVRSGVLLAQYIDRPRRYSGEPLPELDEISSSELKQRLSEILASSPESSELSVEGVAAPGEGVGERPADSALKRFTLSFTERARRGQIDPIFGRHREIRQMVEILARRRKNNPIIVGEPGVGKTALVEGLARAINEGAVPEALREVELLGLDLGLLQAGASVRGEFENRLKAVISEVASSPKPIVLFIDEAHTLIGAGGAPGGGDAANLLKPALARGELRTIAATTYSEYKKYFEKDAALERRFQPVRVEEPSESDAVLMVRGLRETYEASHKVRILDEAVVAAVQLSHRYLAGRQLPDKAIDLLDTAAARVKVLRDGRPEALVASEEQLAGLERHRDALQRERVPDQPAPKALGELESSIARVREEVDRLRVRWDHEREAAKRLLAARAEAAREGAGEAQREAMRAAEAGLGAAREGEPLCPEVVDAGAVAAVVAGWTGIPVGKLKADRLAAALDMEQILGRRIKGQEGVLRAVGEAVRMAYSGIRNPMTPAAVMLFVGPSGVGKTETALALAESLFGGERFLLTINMSEFQEKHTVSRLIGSPPGYVGFGQGGVLTEAVRHHPYSLVLLDECEKADLEVMNLFYQVFDKGQLADGEGRVIDFRNTLLVLTSNLGSEQILRLHAGHPQVSPEQVVEAIRPILSRHFKPALLARMSIVPFAPIGVDAMRNILSEKLAALGQRLKQAHGLEMVRSESLVEALARLCTPEEAGARNIDHILRGGLMPAISRAILEKLATGALPPRLELAIGPGGAWDVAFRDAG